MLSRGKHASSHVRSTTDEAMSTRPSAAFDAGRPAGGEFFPGLGSRITTVSHLPWALPCVYTPQGYSGIRAYPAGRHRASVTCMVETRTRATDGTKQNAVAVKIESKGFSFHHRRQQQQLLCFDLVRSSFVPFFTTRACSANHVSLV